METSERYADGPAGDQELVAARRDMPGAGRRSLDLAALVASGSARYVLRPAVGLALRAARTAGPRRASATDPEGHARALRDIFGNPSCPVHADPAWLAWHGGGIVKLAQAVYDVRELPSGHLDAARLAVLADMLEEAGAADAQLLGHLRSPGPHVRGCFAINAILGKE